MKTKEVATLAVVGALGVAVGVASAYLDPKYVDPTTVLPTRDEKEPSDEFKSACAAWHDNKQHLAGKCSGRFADCARVLTVCGVAVVFRVIGNLVVAPIGMFIVIHRVVGRY